MHIQRTIVQNYRCLRVADVSFNETLNVIVGNNECGKSTLLEAINLALAGQLNGRPALVEMHPYLFNCDLVDEYIADLKRGKHPQPPHILIEVYLSDDPELVRLKGINNSLGLDLPGVSFLIELCPAHAEEYRRYVANPQELRTLPIEYYWIKWRDFADNEIINSRVIPLQVSMIDASAIRNGVSANRYVVDTIRDSLSTKEKVDLALSYRAMKDRFLQEPRVRSVNAALASKGGAVSDKTITVALDTSARASWEAGIMPHLDDIPLPLIGKGEQNAVKIKLALQASSRSHVVLIEEAENHLSYSSLNELIGHISANSAGRQLFITTHSSFVLNKLGVNAVLLFQRGNCLRLSDIKEKSTQEYFKKLPGHDTLRLILAKRSILVEGPSDELIVLRAYRNKHGKSPLEDGVDVISVNSLAFKRFLEIAVELQKPVDVITDNDGNVSALLSKYADYLDLPLVRIQFDRDESAKTLEPQLLQENGLSTVNQILGRDFEDDASALAYMASNKADTALRFFETPINWKPPGYIARAIR